MEKIGKQIHRKRGILQPVRKGAFAEGETEGQENNTENGTSSLRECGGRTVGERGKEA